MKTNKRKAFVGVKSYYYKQKAADAVLDHAHSPRNGFTKSVNIFSEFTNKNKGFYFHESSSCADALKKMCEKHKLVTGKKVRSDNNVLFEHVVFLSEFQYALLERKFGAEKVKNDTMKRLIAYAELVKKEFGFEPLGIDLHLDEGRYEGGKFIRNIHAHVQFMNYSFDKRIAPLRHMMKKGKNTKGRTNKINPNFSKLQDLVHAPFKPLGYHRGEAKDITGREHLKKEDFVKNKLMKLESDARDLVKKELFAQKRILEKEQYCSALEAQLRDKKAELKWLEKKVASLKSLKDDLSNAIKLRSMKAMRLLTKRISGRREINGPKMSK